MKVGRKMKNKSTASMYMLSTGDEHDKGTG